MEFMLGGVAACGAGLFTNPLEVVKTRMQLQGELKAKGQYYVHYRHVFHAFYTISRADGIIALQKGLIPALYYQFFMNGVRLGSYQVIQNYGLTKDSSGNVGFFRSVASGALAGCTGAFVGSPFYMIKTHLQSQSAKSVAVGHQHHHSGFHSAFYQIFKDHGIIGLWRGASGAMARVMVGSALQLGTFSKAKEKIEGTQIFRKESWLNSLAASMASGVMVVAGMTPFDVVSTRLYNQGTDLTGKGLMYTGFFDCFIKIFKKEGVWGFYKGWGASLFRVGPHTVLSLVFWQELRKMTMVR